MRGIKLNNGVTFIEFDEVTIRINDNGKCDLSPIMLPSLEWELRTEDPETWTYITETNIHDFGDDIAQQITEIVKKFHNTIGIYSFFNKVN